MFQQLVMALALTLCSFKCVNYLQLGGYRLSGLLPYFKTKNFLFLLSAFAVSFAVLLFLPELLFYSMLVVLSAVFALERLETKKTPLKFTKRVWRLLLTEFCCFFGLSFLFVVYLIPLLPIVACISLALTYPVEKLIGNYYIAKAKKKLEMSGAVVAAITGSYGKTSVKNALAAILSVKFKVFATPKSYNTPLGIARAVNEADLDGVGIFIAELGARKKNDILFLTKFVKPHYGIITGVAAAHLKTFKSTERIAREKYRLAQNLSDDGCCVFNLDNEFTSRMHAVHAGCKSGVSLRNCGAEVFADGIAASSEGCEFNLHIAGETVKCRTKLLGEHSVLNLCLCAALAHTLGMNAEEIAQGIALVNPVSHRLQLLKGANGLTVLDDSFNANLEGIKASAQTLKLFEGKKAVIASGIAEGGKQSYNLNFAAGEVFSEACDVVILTGPNSGAMAAGLKSKNFNADCIFTEKNLNDAVARANSLLNDGGVLLFSNDLPDNLI